MRVLVTGTSTFFGARIVQELGRQGVHVTAADSVRFSAGKMSRYCEQHLHLPQMGKNPKAWLDQLVNHLQRHQYDLLLPTFEESLLLAEHAAEVSRYTQLMTTRFDTMLAVHCKPVLHERCQKWSIPSPATWWPNDEPELRSLAARLSYPVLLKLPMSNNSVGRIACHCAGDLIHAYQQATSHSMIHPMERPFVQQVISGELICTLMYCHEGRKLGEVIYRSLRTVPDGGGTSAHRESIDHPAIAELTEHFARQTQWSGFVGLDLIVDRDQSAFVIDVNPRANPGTNLGFMAGVNWTSLIQQIVRGESPQFAQAKAGVRTRTVLLDIAWLLESLEKPGNRLAKVRHRLKHFLRPEWRSDGRDLLSCREDWRATLALGLHGFRSLVSSCWHRIPIGQCALEDANYHFATASAMSPKSPPLEHRRAA
ncbi:MAG: ATP-grasp domain-containing protein [Planctomycetaceae bacterium]|nr:ATP-grasp domain-containing protein [Planctomycetaceae bacterium]